jgi:gamma-glutamylcyclotransferase (GGCT)/AIG2-like uncharacterized protein YtfP
MPLLFSYGTLQQEEVQLTAFGRRLAGQRDALPGYSLTSVPEGHANVVSSNDDRASVPGTVFDVTDAELARADTFEQQFSYARILLRLASGREVWVYVHQS